MTSAAVESLLVLCGLGMGSTLPQDFGVYSSSIQMSP